MKKIIIAGLVALCLTFVTGGAALAARNTGLPATAVGTYTYKDNPLTISVGYDPCGITIPGIPDDIIGVTERNKSHINFGAHGVAKVDALLFEYYGVHLSQKASDTLFQDHVLYTCTP
jgi:hypothetical protein